MYISYDYYRIFYYVAKYGNITQAAKILLNNQPNLTRAIKTLESELGCPLFIRNNRGMKLTPEGERLFVHIRRALENIKAGEEEIIESRNLEKGSIFVAASEVALHCVLLPVLKEYRTLYPGIRFKISNHSTPQAIDAIKNGMALLTEDRRKTGIIGPGHDGRDHCAKISRGCGMQFCFFRTFKRQSKFFGIA